jgi:ABC-type antimicrobial peptide transport system ATPase subunit
MIPALAMIISAYCLARLIQIWLELLARYPQNMVLIVTVGIIFLIAGAVIVLNMGDVIHAGSSPTLHGLTP